MLRHEPLLNRVETQDFGRREGADVQPSPIVVVDQHHFVDLKSILINRMYRGSTCGILIPDGSSCVNVICCGAVTNPMIACRSSGGVLDETWVFCRTL